jgi:hypothetical protein
MIVSMRYEVRETERSMSTDSDLIDRAAKADQWRGTEGADVQPVRGTEGFVTSFVRGAEGARGGLRFVS